MTRYRGRFAPSPTGPLHAGSLAAALGSWLDARAHGGAWLVRIEDVDRPRCLPGMGEHQLAQLARCGLISDEPVLWQHTRDHAYADTLVRLQGAALAYPCACSRRDIDEALAAAGRSPPRHGERVYPGTCRNGLQGRDARAVRLRTDAAGGTTTVAWVDRRLGSQQQDVAQAVGDFVLRRADGLWAYQLAVVVDDAAQGISAVVRGEDLADNTPRQVLLQRALQLPTPQYLHTPLVLGADGQKLSKQNGAQPLDLGDDARVADALRRAAVTLELPPLPGKRAAEVLAAGLLAWQARLEAGIITPFHATEP